MVTPSAIITRSYPAFSPASISGLSGWYDASQITGQSDNTALSTWLDLSGNGLHLTQSGTARPTYYSSTVGQTINGLPAVWFASASSQYMSRTSSRWANASNGSWSAYMVGIISTNTAAMIPFNQYDGVNEAIRLDNTTTGGAPRSVAWDTNPAAHTATQGTFTTGSVFQFGAVAGFSGGNSSLTCIFNRVSSSPTLWVASSYYIGSAATVGLGTLFNGGPRFYWNGAIAEVALWSRGLTPTEQSQLQSYWQTKWGTP